MAEKIPMLALSPTMEEGVIVKWSKSQGQSISQGEVICEVETDKAVMEFESPCEGILLKIVVEAEQKASIGQTIAIVGRENEDVSSLLSELQEKAELPTHEAPVTIPKKPERSAKETVTADTQGRMRISPMARKMAKEHGLDLKQIQGTGPNGRIISRDVEQAISQRYLISTDDKIIPISQKRKVIARRLSESKYSAPHYYLKTSVIADNLLKAKKQLTGSQQNKISLNAFLIRFVAEMIKKHPIINSTWGGDKIIRHSKVDIGLAVAQDDGLIVPVVKNCTSKGVLQINSELRILVEKAINNTLSPTEYTGATFTVSNLGGLGVEEFTAIINPPGSAILAVGAITKQPIVADGENISIASIMKLTLSCDHRLIDGAVGAAFLRDLKELVENPVAKLYL